MIIKEKEKNKIDLSIYDKELYLRSIEIIE